MTNIKVVDDIVRDTEQLISDYYGDAETSYIFTADHGMSNIGNHGDGGSPLTSCSRQYLTMSYRSRQYTHTLGSMGEGRSGAFARLGTFLA
jgi:hypothetical protein